MFASLNFQSAMKAEYIGIFRCNLCQFCEYFFGLADLPGARQFGSARP